MYLSCLLRLIKNISIRYRYKVEVGSQVSKKIHVCLLLTSIVCNICGCMLLYMWYVCVYVSGIVFAQDRAALHAHALTRPITSSSAHTPRVSTHPQPGLSAAASRPWPVTRRLIAHCKVGRLISLKASILPTPVAVLTSLYNQGYILQGICPYIQTFHKDLSVANIAAISQSGGIFS